jgi:aconitate hydratase
VGQDPFLDRPVYEWDTASTYIQEPPFFTQESARPSDPEDHPQGARVLAIFGDSVTTDHISPAGNIKAARARPASTWWSTAWPRPTFNSYGARRGNHEVMMRGTFANVRIKNLMVPGSEAASPCTTCRRGPSRCRSTTRPCKYLEEGTPLIIFAGEEYGMGSSRDWAAKGTQLLGVKAVVAKSFERIHRSNLAGMGVLPLQFKDGTGAADLGLKGDEAFDLVGLENGITPQQDLTLVIKRADGSSQNVPVKLRLDTPIEIEYYQAGGILPYVLSQLLA